MIDKLQLINQICRKIGIARKRQNLQAFSKEELYTLWAYLTITPNEAQHETMSKMS